MLFMAEMEVRLPPDMPAERADELRAREREYSQAAQRDGRWPHLWRVAGRYANVSVLDDRLVDAPQDVRDQLVGTFRHRSLLGRWHWDGAPAL